MDITKPKAEWYPSAKSRVWFNALYQTEYGFCFYTTLYLEYKMEQVAI